MKIVGGLLVGLGGVIVFVSLATGTMAAGRAWEFRDLLKALGLSLIPTVVGFGILSLGLCLL